MTPNVLFFLNSKINKMQKLFEFVSDILLATHVCFMCEANVWK